MLPAISADLPAALIPPSRKETSQTTAEEPGFGPSSRVDFSTEQAIKGQSKEPGNSLYAADGQFVENAGRRKLPDSPPDESPAPPVREVRAEKPEAQPENNARNVEAETARRADTTSETPDEDEVATSAANTDAAARADVRRARNDSRDRVHAEARQAQEAADAEKARKRDLALSEFNAVVPPAAREELVALADRVNQRSTSRSLSSKDYKLISDLMVRVGRFSEANEAFEKATELENGGKAE